MLVRASKDFAAGGRCVYYLTPYCPSSLTALYLRFVAVTISRIFWSTVNGADHQVACQAFKPVVLARVEWTLSSASSGLLHRPLQDIARHLWT